MKAFSLALRSFLVACFALLAVVLAAFPDWVLPQAEIAASMHRVAMEHVHNWMWLLPLLAMEVVAALGAHRNRAWFTGLLAAWVLVVLALPVLRWYAPELVTRTHPAENVKLYPVVFGMTVFVAVSLFFRLTILRYMFPPCSPSDESGFYVGEDLTMSPRTVQEIVASPPRRRKYFLFGMVDEEKLRRWGIAGKAALALFRSRVQWAMAGCVLLLVWNVVFFYAAGGSEGERERDLERLGEFRRTPEGGMRATSRATHAAYRLFGDIDKRQLFNGKSREEMVQFLRLDSWDPAYRKQAMEPLDELYSLRERWLTIDDGSKKADLFLYLDKKTGLVVQAERDEKGWDPSLDDYRSRLGVDLGR